MVSYRPALWWLMAQQYVMKPQIMPIPNNLRWQFRIMMIHTLQIGLYLIIRQSRQTPALLSFLQAFVKDNYKAMMWPVSDHHRIDIEYIFYIETILKAVVCCCLVTTAVDSNLRVVSITSIPDQVRRLHVITCDICGIGMASYDVFVDGVIEGATVLKRCCNECIKSFGQP